MSAASYVKHRAWGFSIHLGQTLPFYTSHDGRGSARGPCPSNATRCVPHGSSTDSTSFSYFENPNSHSAPPVIWIFSKLKSQRNVINESHRCTHIHISIHLLKIVGNVTCLYPFYPCTSHILLEHLWMNTCWRNRSSKNIWVGKYTHQLKTILIMTDTIVMFLC